MAEKDKIEALKQTRSRERAKATKSLNRLKLLYQASDADADDLAYVIHLNEKQLAALEQLGEELEGFEVQDDSNHVSDLEEWIFKAKRLLERLEKRTDAPQSGAEMHGRFKLDLHLPKYGGDLLAWPEFWELYTAAVHRNTSYSVVEKFVFLRGHLTGEAARAIQGLATTEGNYQIAVDILQDRFGKDDVRKETLMANLLHLPAVTNPDDLKSLRRLIDDLTANVRALEALDTPSGNYGELLLPVLKGKIPVDWRLQWARSRGTIGGSGDSEFTRFMKFLKEEIRIREEASLVPCLLPEARFTGNLTSLLVMSATRATKTHQIQVSDENGEQELTVSEADRRLETSSSWKSADRPISDLRSTELASTVMSRLNEQAVEVDETEPIRVMASSLIKHPPFEDASHLPGESKERPHGGENRPGPDVAKENSPRNSRERTHSGEQMFRAGAQESGGGKHDHRKLPHADAEGGSTDQGGKPGPPEPPERCSTPRDDSGVVRTSDLTSPLADDPTNAFFLPHRGICRENLRRSLDSPVETKNLPIASQDGSSSRSPTQAASSGKEMIWRMRKMMNLPSTYQVRRSMSRTRNWKRKRWKNHRIQPFCCSASHQSVEWYPTLGFTWIVWTGRGVTDAALATT